MDSNALNLMLQLADAADVLTGEGWDNSDLVIKVKPDGSPVTAIDLAVENELRGLVGQRFPADGFVGEEVGVSESSSGRQWVVDGIDGTAAFVQGRREWSTLISLVESGRVVAGLASSPALGRRWSGVSGRGAEVLTSDGQRRPLEVSDQPRLAGANIASWPHTASTTDRFRASAERLAVLSAPPTKRPSWNAEVPNGAMLVAEGRLDAFVLFGGEVWDHAACSAIVIAAGGRWSDLDGNEHVRGGAGVYSNGRIHDPLLSALGSP